MRTSVVLAGLLACSLARASTTDEHRALMISGQVMRHEGRLLRARDIFTSCRDSVCEDALDECEGIRKFCATKLVEVEGELPSLVVRVRDDRGAPVRASVHVDEVVVDPSSSIQLDPGRHVVRAVYAGVANSNEATLEKGKKGSVVDVTLDLRTQVRTRPVPGLVYVFGVTAGVAVLAATGFGIAAQVQTSDLAFCKPSCDPSHRGLLTATTATVDAAWIVAGVSALATMFAYFLRPTRTSIVHLEERIGGSTP